MVNEDKYISKRTVDKDQGKKFSELVSMDDLERHLAESRAVCYVAGTGSGKSYWVKNILAKKGTILFLTSRIAKVLEDTEKEPEEGEQKFTNDFEEPYYNTVTTMKLAKRIKKPLSGYLYSEDATRYLDSFLARYDYIVVDEIHALACDSTFQEDIFLVQKFIEYAAFVAKKPVIGLTATIEPIKEYLSNFRYEEQKWKVVNLKDSKFTLPVITEIYANEDVKTCLEKCIQAERKFVYFANFPARVKEIYNFCIELGVSKKDIAVMISEQKREKFEKSLGDDSDDQAVVNREAYDMLLKDNRLPKNVKVLIATSHLREGVNIKNEDFKTVVCEAHYLADIIQYVGRIRSYATLCL